MLIDSQFSHAHYYRMYPRAYVLGYMLLDVFHKIYMLCLISDIYQLWKIVIRNNYNFK
jgi:hypothetical protein